MKNFWTISTLLLLGSLLAWSGAAKAQQWNFNVDGTITVTATTGHSGVPAVAYAYGNTGGGANYIYVADFALVALGDGAWADSLSAWANVWNNRLQDVDIYYEWDDGGGNNPPTSGVDFQWMGTQTTSGASLADHGASASASQDASSSAAITDLGSTIASENVMAMTVPNDNNLHYNVGLDPVYIDGDTGWLYTSSYGLWGMQVVQKNNNTTSGFSVGSGASVTIIDYIYTGEYANYFYTGPGSDVTIYETIQLTDVNAFQPYGGGVAASASSPTAGLNHQAAVGWIGMEMVTGLMHP